MNFHEQVYKIVAVIPLGKVVSYGDIAKWLGRPRSARAVGWAMSSCPPDLPWQRVVMADGSITGGECAERRRTILEQESICFTAEGRVDMRKHRWSPPPDIDIRYFRKDS